MSDSAWDVEQMLRNAAKLQVSDLLKGSPDVPDGLREVVESGRSVLLLGRAGGPPGRTSRLNAAEDVWSAAESLHAQTGLDVRDSLLPVEEMAAFLDSHGLEGDRSSVPAARRGPRRRVALMASPDGSVLVLLVAGHAVSSAIDDLSVLLAGLVRHRATNVGAFWCTRVDRVARVAGGTDRVLQALRERGASGPVWAGDGATGAWAPDAWSFGSGTGAGFYGVGLPIATRNRRLGSLAEAKVLQAKRRAGLPGLAAAPRKEVDDA